MATTNFSSSNFSSSTMNIELHWGPQNHNESGAPGVPKIYDTGTKIAYIYIEAAALIP